MTIPFFNAASLKDRTFLSRQLATMLGSGIPLVEALKVLLLQTKNQTVKTALGEIIRDIESGLSFSSAIDRQPQLFSKIYTAVARSGEASGRLEDVLLHLADNIEKENVMAGKIKGALIYPVFVLTAMIGVAILMMVRVIPQLRSIFDESNIVLPITTRLLLASSDFMVRYWWLVVILLIAGVAGLVWYIKTPNGSLILNNIQVRLPTNLGEDLYMGRFTRTMSMLITSGLPIIQALDITSQVMNNKIYQASLIQAQADVGRGLPLSVSLNQNRFYPKIVTQMILVGEQTGRLDQLMEKLAGYYENELDTKVKGIATLIEPLVIVTLGIGVAFLVIAVLMPIYNLTQVQ